MGSRATDLSSYSEHSFSGSKIKGSRSSLYRNNNSEWLLFPYVIHINFIFISEEIMYLLPNNKYYYEIFLNSNRQYTTCIFFILVLYYFPWNSDNSTKILEWSSIPLEWKKIHIIVYNSKYTLVKLEYFNCNHINNLLS